MHNVYHLVKVHLAWYFGKVNISSNNWKSCVKFYWHALNRAKGQFYSKIIDSSVSLAGLENFFGRVALNKDPTKHGLTSLLPPKTIHEFYNQKIVMNQEYFMRDIMKSSRQVQLTNLSLSNLCSNWHAPFTLEEPGWLE